MTVPVTRRATLGDRPIAGSHPSMERLKPCPHSRRIRRQ